MDKSKLTLVDTTPDGIQKVLDGCENHAVSKDDFILEWSKTGVGFGTAHFWFDETTGEYKCDSERMTKAFIKEMLCKMVDDSVFE